MARFALALLAMGLPSVVSAEETVRQRELWVPEKSLPHILAANPKAVVLSRAEYQALVKDAATPVAPKVITAPTPVVLRSAAYRGQISGNAVLATADFQIDVLADQPDAWQVLELPIPIESLGTVKLDETTAIRLIAGEGGKPTGAASVLLRTPGTHHLTATFYLPITGTSTQQISLKRLPAAAANFALELPERFSVALPNTVASAKLPNGNFLHTMPMPAGADDFVMQWRAKDLAPLTGGAVLQTCSYLYQIDPARVTSDLGIVLRSPLARVPQDVTMPLPETARVLSVEGPDVSTWSLDGTTIKVHFTTADLTVTNLRVLLETPPTAAAEPGHPELSVSLPQPAVAEVHRASGSFAIMAAPEVRVRSIATGGLTAQTTEGLPGDAAKQPGFVAGFAFPVLAAPPTVTFQELEPRFQTDQLLHVELRRDKVELRRTLRLLVKEGKIFTTTIHLPEGEETTSLTLADGTEPQWKAGPERTIEVKWAAPITTTAPGSLTLVTRMDPAGWFTLGENARPLTIGSAVVDGPELTTGYVALDFDERFHVVTTGTVGLEPSDPAHLKANGVPLTGQLIWTRADQFTLELAVSRRPSEVHAHITSYALPLLHTCELEGQIELQVKNSGLRSLLVAAPVGLAETLRFDSPLIAEKKLQPLTGEWTLTFHEELSGTPRLRYHWSLPLTTAKAEGESPAPDATQAQSRFSTVLPVLKLPEAGRVTGTYVIEANTDTELTITPQGLDDRDILALPKVENYQPRHRVIAAYGWRGSAWQLSLEGTRHPAAPLPGMVIDGLLIQSILNPDGTQRHQLTFNLRSNGEQFFSCPLPAEAKILSLAIDDAPVKPVADPTLRAKQQNGLRIQLPATIEARSASIQLTYEVPAAAWDSSGDISLTPPPLNPAIPVLSSHWYLHLPDGYTYSNFTSNLRKEFSMPTASLASAVGSHLPDFGGQRYPTCKIQVHARPVNVFDSAGLSSNWLESQISLVKSPETLRIAVRAKRLAERWKLSESEAIAKLAELIRVNQERGTDLFYISCVAENQVEGAELANAVGDAYQEYKLAIEKGRNEAGINMLAKELDDQEKKVEERRVGMLNQMKKYNIVDFSGVHGMFQSLGGVVEDGREQSLIGQKSRIPEYEAEVGKLRAQLKALQAVKDEDQLIEISSGMGFEGPTLKESMPRFHAAKIELQQLLDSGLAQQHPSVVAARGQVEYLKKNLTSAVEGLKRTLDTKVEIAEAGLKSLKNSSGNNEATLATDKARQSEYMMAKREYEQQFALLNEMREHVLKQKVDLEMPMLPVQVHENAVPMDEAAKGYALSKSSSVATPPPPPEAPKSEPQAMVESKPQQMDFTGKGDKAAAGQKVNFVAANAGFDDGKKVLELTSSYALANDKFTASNLAFSGLVIGKSGLIPLAVDLPGAGLTYGFTGNHPPSELKLHFVTWRHDMQFGWAFVLVGALLAWIVARRRPIFLGLCLALPLHFLPQILGNGLQKPCNAMLLGLVVVCLVRIIFNFFSARIKPRAVPAALVLLACCGIQTNAQAESTPASYSAFVPFDSTKPLADQTPGRYFLTYETFQKLWAQARANKLKAGAEPATIDTKGEPWAGIQSALYQGQILPDRLKLEAVLTVVSTGKWASVALGFQGVTSLTLDGASAPLSDQKLLIEKPGTHTVIAKLEIPLASNWQAVATPLPQSAASLVTLSLTDMSARLDVNHGRPVVETATAEGVPQRHLTAALGNVTELHLQRDLGARMANAAQSLPPSAKLIAALYLSPALERLEAGIDFDFPGGDRQEFSVELDPTLTPVSVDIPNVEKWSLTSAADKQTLQFRLTLPVREKLHLTLTAERPVGGNTFPSVWPVASRVERELRLLAVDELEVTMQPSPSHQQTDFPAAGAADPGFQRLAAYQVAGPPVPLGFKTARRTLNSALQADYLYQISPSKLEIHAVFGIKPARGQDLLHTSAVIPNGFTVTRVDSDRLQDWWVDGDRLRIRFSGPTPEATTLLLGLAQPWKEPPAQLELAPVALENVGSVRGRAQLAALPDVNAVLNFANQKASQIRETSQGEQLEEYPPIGDFKLTSPFEAKRTFTFNVPEFTASVALGKVPARFDTRWVLAAEVQESWVRLEARIDLEVKSGALSEFNLQLPASAVATSEPRLTGEHIREMVRMPAAAGADAAAPVRYKVSLQRPITTATQATLALEIPHQGEIHLPDLTFPDAGLNERFVVVQNASAGELHYEAKRSLHAEPLQARDVERDLHFRIQEFTQPSYYRVGADWDTVFTLEKLATTTGTKALVLYAELTTALRVNGEEWLQADYRLQNRSLQFLPVRLPDGYTLMSALVNEQPVRADQGVRDKLPVLLIPLIQTRPGDLALQVRLVARRMPNANGDLPERMNLGLDDPELPGVTIERTVWRVALPDGYVVKDAKGNMDAVAAKDAKFEEEAAVVTELSSLLSMCNNVHNPVELRERSRRNAQNIASNWSSNRAAGDLPNSNSQVDQLLQQTQQLKYPIVDPGAFNPQGQAVNLGGSVWNWAGNSTYLKGREQKQAEVTKQEAQLNKDNLGLNDNVIVGNRTLYYKYNAPQAKGKADDGKDVNQRSKAVSKLQQADAGDATTVGDQLKQLDQQRFAVQLDGANTYTGGTTVVAGTLTTANTAIPAGAVSVNGAMTAGDFNNGIAQTGEVLTKNKVDFEQNYQNGGNRASKLPAKPASGPAPPAPAEPQAVAAKPDPNPEGFSYDLATVTSPQKLRPAGRVSLPISFPFDTELSFYKKVKDHASMVLVAEKAAVNPGKRIQAMVILGTSLFLLILINAIYQSHKRRKAKRK